MNFDTSGDARTVAIEQLKTLGLTTYGARTFVALHEIDGGTAKDVATISDVPRTRVYDAVSELAEHGLATIESGDPKRFHAVSPETAANRLRTEYDDHVATMAESLGTIAPNPASSERRGVWAATGHETVTDRIVRFVQRAEAEVGFVTDGALVDDAVVDALVDAHDRGVDVMVAMPETADDDVFGSLPADVSVATAWGDSFEPVVRMLVVDGTTTVASVVPPRDEDVEETAVWAIGEDNEVATVVRSLALNALSSARSSPATQT